MLQRIDALHWFSLRPLAVWPLAFAAVIGGAAAQPAPTPSDDPPAQQSAPPPKENPGLINELGKLLKSTPSLLPSINLPNAAPNADPAPDVATPTPPPPTTPVPSAPPPVIAAPKPPVPAAPPPAAQPPEQQAAPTAPPDSGGGLGASLGLGLGIGLPRSLMVTGRMVCPISANGAPDCKIASDKLCQTKGFREGKSLDTDAAETCSPKVFIPGRKREPGDCKMDSFVTRAICQ